MTDPDPLDAVNRIAALPLDRFSAFLAFAKTAAAEGWECGSRRRWQVADAAAAVASVTYALGEFSIIAESLEAAELRALA